LARRVRLGVSRATAFACLILSELLVPVLQETIHDASPVTATSAAPIVPADSFLENAGQLSNPEMRFYTAPGAVQFGFAEGSAFIKIVERRPEPGAERRTARGFMGPDPPGPLRGVLLRVSFEGANAVIPQGLDPLPHVTNFFLGNDPSRWRTGVRSYRGIVYPDVYDGVDILYRIGPDGLKYDVTVRPGADPEKIIMVYEGIEDLERKDLGLVVRTAVGDLFDSIPRSYQGDAEVSCGFDLRTPRSHGFACLGWDPGRPLVIDPLLYSTFLGGATQDNGISLAVDASGSAYVTGATYSTDFPTTPGAFDTSLEAPSDVFVAKLNATGSGLVYATYLGGSSFEQAVSIAVDASGSSYVTGVTVSPNFPTTPGAFDASISVDDVFVAKLNATGSGLVYATYLGGGDADWGWSVAVDGSGSAYVTGETFSPDFPTTPGAFDTTYNGLRDAFVAKLNATGSGLVYATYLGGSDRDNGRGIAVDASASAYITGGTYSVDFPTTPGAFDGALGGLDDAFVAKLTETGTGLLYSTYLGGSSSDEGFSVQVHALGSAYATGATASADFPTTPAAIDTTFNGIMDSFVAKLEATGSGLLYATYLGGGGYDRGYSVAVDASGSALVTGFTPSTDFPTTPGAFDTSFNGLLDAFVASLGLPPSQDTTPPIVAITSPADRTWTNADPVPIAGTASDVGLGLARVELSCDGGGTWTVATGTDSWSDTCSGLGEGAHAVVGRAFDLAGLVSDLDVINITVDRTPPASPLVTRADLAGSAFEDLQLTWDASQDEGLPGGTAAYRVLRARGDPAALYNPVADVNATGFTSYTYTCAGCGHLPGNATPSFYRTQATDAAGNAASGNLAARYARVVGTGPHLLAIPLHLTDYGVPGVLRTLSHGGVRAYRAGTVDPWGAWYPDRAGDLTILGFAEAFWVNVTAAGQYTVVGLVQTNPSVPLVAGWNLVGYAAFANDTWEESLAGLPVVHVESFDPGGPYHLRVVTSGEVLVWGEAYWIDATAAGLWVQS